MDYRLAKQDELDVIYDLVQSTIKDIYPKYYLKEIVDMFCNFHNRENISKDINKGNTYALLENGIIIGTGTIRENHITRVYVHPTAQGNGHGTYIMNMLEQELSKNYKKVEIDASLPACRLYYKLGYVTVDHGIWECEKGVIQVYEIMEKELAKTNLRLRPYKPSDAKTILSWVKDEDAFRKWTSDRYDHYPITPEDMNHKYIDCNGDCSEDDNFYPFTAFDESGIVGHLILRYTDSEKKTLRIGFVIVDDSKRGKGYGKQMIIQASKYAFEIFGAKKVTLGVFANNQPTYHCYKAAGFEELPAEKDSYYELFGEKWRCIEMERVISK